MEPLFVTPLDIALGLAAALIAGALCGFLLRGGLERRQQERRARARKAMTAGPPSGPHSGPHSGRPSRENPTPLPLPRIERTMPVRAAPPSGTRTTPPRSTPDPRTGLGLTVLVADDRPELRTMNAAYLKGHGYRVIESADGDGALTAARREHPDVILLDHSMPKRTGLEVVRELKADPATRTIPIVFMTAHSFGAIGRSAMAAGCVAYLPKPCDPSRVLQEVVRHTRGLTAPA